ncbi:class I adenylate-forming enzyme family protein [Bordetella sp. N]|uniref:class I adenylate-forming enzyme family protein n=1 Tax=Bordetella sp. N TaxID=1746199 RepID=UPI00070FB330|nr:class I adenylate-forming enzyme family protein [Bordetella sp. N]ALM86728.1 AMP-dependent synthetase [Bordetella sp. N]
MSHSPYNLGDLWDHERPADDMAVVDLRDPDHPRRYSHADIDAQARGVARLLSARGLQPGDRVGILSGNRAEYVSVYSGITRAGLIAVPLNNKAPAETVQYVIQDADVSLVFTDHEQLPKLPGSVPFVDLDDSGPAGYTAVLDHGAFDTWRPEQDSIAEILYTSGSTGKPKGVPLTHAGQFWMASRRQGAPETSGLVHIIAQPLFHMAGLLVAKRGLQQHGVLVIFAAFEARRYLQALADYRVTHVQAVPTVLARLLKEADLLARLDLSALRVISLGSAPMTASLFEKVRLAFPHAILTHGYGSTEAGGGVFGPHPEGIATPPIAVGVPHPGIEVRLTDGPHEDEGVMLLRSPGVMTHYLNLPEVTAKVFRDGWYYTGDVMRRDAQGFYFFVGRADDMFVCAGENIYPGEVEKTLERHPSVHQACVVPLEDEERGQIPVAFVVASRDADMLDAPALKAHALAHGPAYQHPRRIAIVPDLPWAGTNKIDRNALKREAVVRERAGNWAR